MGCANSKDEKTSGGKRSEAEKHAAAKRGEISAAAIRKLVGAKADAKTPTVALAVSGGGWRAVTGTVAFLDGLAEAKLLDCVTYASGVSGGGWVLYEWMLMNADNNPFHKPGAKNPWFHGNSFDASEATYEGLVYMRDIAHVRKSALFDDKKFDGVLSEVIQAAGGSHMLIPAVLASTQLGKSPIERWSAFLKDDLLYWLPPGSSGEIPSTGHVADGTSPVLLTALVASDADRKTYDWIESSPFGLRRLPPHGVDPLPNEALRITYKNGDKVEHVKTWHLMAASGAWFGMDAKNLMHQATPGLSKGLEDLGISFSEESMLGGTVSDFHNADGTIHYGETRDAGVRENVGYPLVMPNSSGRHVDILVVLEDSKKLMPNSSSVADAVELGLIPKDVYDTSNASELLDEKRGFHRVFKPLKEGFPIIVFCLGLDKESTLHLTASKEEVLEQVRTVRTRFAHHYAKAIIGEIKAFMNVQ